MLAWGLGTCSTDLAVDRGCCQRRAKRTRVLVSRTRRCEREGSLGGEDEVESTRHKPVVQTALPKRRCRSVASIASAAATTASVATSASRASIASRASDRRRSSRGTVATRDATLGEHARPRLAKRSRGKDVVRARAERVGAIPSGRRRQRAHRRRIGERDGVASGARPAPRASTALPPPTTTTATSQTTEAAPS